MWHGSVDGLDLNEKIRNKCEKVNRRKKKKVKKTRGQSMSRCDYPLKIIERRAPLLLKKKKKNGTRW